ncbi:MAG: von Willebrand factor type A domain-containing protein [Bacteroidetes bacterium]|nr:von Willebrand factor type A domain-containing protein [Bacteroidota bacterium]
MKKHIIILAVLLIASMGFIAPEERTISGTVASESDGRPLAGVLIKLKGSSINTFSDSQGSYIIKVPSTGGTLVYSMVAMKTKEVPIGNQNRIDVALQLDVTNPDLKNLADSSPTLQGRLAGVAIQSRGNKMKRFNGNAVAEYKSYDIIENEFQPANTEEYAGISENGFHDPLKDPLSTFSIDVDAASYSNIRRFIHLGQRPPKDAVRVEEMINYFDYDYAQPKGEDPFSITTEISSAPWNPKHKLVHIGLQGKNIAKDNLPPSNLVFLIDVSGSMSDENKLPLLKASFKLLVEQLREQDRVAIVVYAGAAGLVLPSTSGSDKQRIIEALENLQAGGSTAGGAGIRLAYEIAKENFKKGGNNRVILATDGDFNVGESSNDAMEKLIESKRNDGIFLTTLGFGMGNYKDSKMEVLADKGNGNYMYIDSILEAQKALVNEFGGTLFTIAKDVKLQIEFNPAKVKSYRLIGYENRMLKSEDFNNDKKDAGELGSGHSVTALYEVIPVGVESSFDLVDALKYQPVKKQDPVQVNKSDLSNEILTVKFRYKKPDGDVSKLIVHPLVDEHVAIEKTSENFRWSAAVAGFGMILRESEYVKNYSAAEAIKLAQGAKGKDVEGYRIEFINLMKSTPAVAIR